MKELFDIINFFAKYYDKFIFTLDDAVEEKLNKSIMFCLYATILFMVLGLKTVVIPFTFIIVILLYKSLYIKEDFIVEKKCRKSTIDNPFMNPLYEADGLEACETDEKEIKKNYENNLFRGIKDVFDKRHGQLYYKTNNVTTIPNKYKEFLDFIKMTYDEPDNNCKYNGVNCLEYNDLRIR